jgi:ABC-2 type transport system permease protein/lipopolysaccharide transport system permease protein
MIISVLCIKNRDLTQLISSIMGVLTFVTPIIFMIELFPGRAALISFNPFFHLLEIIRDPLLGNQPDFQNYSVSLSILLFLFLIITRYFTLNNVRRLFTWL